MKKLAILLSVAVITVAISVYLSTQNVLSLAAKPDNSSTIGNQGQHKTAATPTGWSGSTITNKPILQKMMAANNLPEHMSSIVVQYAYEPTWATARMLKPEDKTLLLQLYHQEPALVKKRGLTIALGFVGDEEVVSVFKSVLADAYAGRKLEIGNGDNTSNEEILMHTTVEALGFLANQSDSAYELLQNGVDPRFWKSYCKFIPGSGASFYGILTARSIQAVGWSGRANAGEFLRSLRSHDLVNTLDNSIMQMSFDGALVTAAFANDIITTQGLEYYKFLYLNFDARLQRLHEWKKQGVGQEWTIWVKERERAQ